MSSLPTLDGGKSLLVGIDDAPPEPIQMGVPEAGDFCGYEVDLLVDLAKRLGVQLRYRRALWSVIVGELSAGSLDVVCSAATVTEERKDFLDFCRPHLEIFLAVVRRSDDVLGMDLRDARVGVRVSTEAEAFVRRNAGAATVMRSESNGELYSALKNRVIDAVVDDSPIAGYFSRKTLELRLCGLVPGSEASYAVMLRKGNTALRNAIDATLVEMASDGTLRAAKNKWLNEP